MSVEILTPIRVIESTNQDSFIILIPGQKQVNLNRKEAEDVIAELKLIDLAVIDWYVRLKLGLSPQETFPTQTLVTCPEINLGKRHLDILHRELSFCVLDLTPREWFRYRINIDKTQPEREALYSEITSG